MAAMELLDVQHESLRLELDLLGAVLHGSCRVKCRRPVGSVCYLNFGGTAVHSVSAVGPASAPARVVPHILLPASAALRSVATLDRGLEVRHVLLSEAVGRRGAELRLELPPDLHADPDGSLLLDVSFEVRGDSGPLRFVSTPAGPYAFTLMRPADSASTWAGGAVGAACVFPCVDLPTSRCTWDVEVTLAGADEGGRVRHLEGLGVQMDVIAAGQPAGAGAPSDVYVSANGARVRRWRYVLPHRVPASAVGFVVAPLTSADAVHVQIPIAPVPHKRGVAPAPAAAAPSADGRAAAAPPGGARMTGKRGALAGPAGSSTRTVTVEHHCVHSKIADGSAALHIKRTRRMLLWYAEFLGTPYPLAHHAHVFLPPAVLASVAGVQACSAGLLPSGRGSCTSASPIHGLVEQDVYPMAGLTLYPDSLLTTARVVDADAGAQRAMAYGISRTFFGCLVTGREWQDAWMIVGAAGYVVDMYMRSFRGQSEWELGHAALCEVVARLEEEHPDVLALVPSGALAEQALTTAVCSHPLRDHLLELKGRAVWRIASGQFKEESVRAVLRALLGSTAGGAAGGQAGGVAVAAPAGVQGSQPLPPSSDAGEVGGCFSTSDFAALLKTASGSSLRSNPKVPLSDPVDLLLHQWVHGRGVPHLKVGVHVNNTLNQVEVVVEQVLRVGAVCARPSFAKDVNAFAGGTDAEIVGSLFLGPLTLHVVERPDAGSDANALPSTWLHTVNIKRARELFILPCHIRVGRTPLERLNALPIMRKAGRPKLDRNAAVVEAAVTSAAAGVGKAVLGHPDELNDTSVLRVRVDPACGWLMRVHVSAPPALLLHQIQHDPSPLAQMQALASLADVGLGTATYIPMGVLARPSWDALGNPFPLLDAGVTPGGTQAGTDPHVIMASTTIIDAQTVLQAVGMLPRPIEAMTPVYRAAAVLVGLDPTSVPLPLRLKAKYHDVAGEGKEKDAVVLEGGAPAPERIRPAPFAEDALETDWRVSCAASFALARWQTGHLPAHGRVFSVHHSWAALGVLLSVYQCLYYTQVALPVAAAVAASAAPSSSGVMRAVLEAACGWGEDVVAAIAGGGEQAPLSVTSIEDVALRQALVASIASIRHADGNTPDVVLTFLSRVVQGYDSRYTAPTFDDSPVLTTLVTALGQALLDSHGAKAVKSARGKARPSKASASSSDGSGRGEGGVPSGTLSSAEEAWAKFLPNSTVEGGNGKVAAFKAGWLVLREQVALELSSMRYAAMLSGQGGGEGLGAGVDPAQVCPAMDDATKGRAASAAIAAVTALEAAGAAPVTLAPMLRFYLLPVHPVSLLPVPPCVRVAAVAGVARVLLGAGPSRHPHGTKGWMDAAAALLSAVTAAGGSGSDAFTLSALLCLAELQRRTDHIPRSDASEEQEEVDEEMDEGGGKVSEVDGWLLARVEHDLKRLCGLDRGVRVSGSEPWTLPELAVDFGLFDGHADKLSLHERRLYGGLRSAAAHTSLLTPLSRASGGSEGPVAARALRALWTSLTSATDGRVRLAGQALLHSIVGMQPPLSTRPTAAAVASADEDMQGGGAPPPRPAAPAPPDAFAHLRDGALPAAAVAPLLAKLQSFADARRFAVVFLRASALTLHTHGERVHAGVRDLPTATGTAAVIVEHEEEGGEEEEEDAQDADDPTNESGKGGGAAPPGPPPPPPPPPPSDEDSVYEYDDEDDEYKANKRGRKPKHPKVKQGAPPAAPSVSAVPSGSRPQRASSAKVQQLMRSALAGAPDDPEIATRGRPPGSGARPQQLASSQSMFALGGGEEEDAGASLAKRSRLALSSSSSSAPRPSVGGGGGGVPTLPAGQPAHRA